MLGLLVLAAFALIALLAPLIAPAEGLEVTKATGGVLEPPSLEYPLGTDDKGRSVLTLLIWGARISLFVGLAATFAGGCPADGLAGLRAAAGEYADELALGSVFAAKARTFSGCVPEHSRVATETLTGLPVGDAVAIADATEVTPDETGPGGEPAYEVWRERIRTYFRAADTKAA